MKKNMGYNIKFKYLTLDELTINIDRLSRFKLPEDSYLRVFSNILTKCLISPKFSKKEIEKLPYEDISYMTKIIWNESVKNIFGEIDKKKNSKILKFIVNETFKNVDKKTQLLVDTELYIDQIINVIDYKTAPINLKFLIKCYNLKTKKTILEKSRKNNLLFPVRKLVIVEGITEEILLPEFARKLGKSFEKNGIFILGAGGKSKSPSLYNNLKDKLKVPVVLLFDSDAKEICNILRNKLLAKDKSIIIESGEFEDIISVNLIKRALNKEYEVAIPLKKNDLTLHDKMCENILQFYRTRHLGEYKKAKVSKIIAKNMKYKTDITDEIKDIIYQIFN